MSRLVRMDETGHTTVAEWTLNDPPAVEAAVVAFRAELDRGYFAVVSEGEGHAEHVRELSRLGCGLAQGFHFSRPVPADEITHALERGPHWLGAREA